MPTQSTHQTKVMTVINWLLTRSGYEIRRKDAHKLDEVMVLLRQHPYLLESIPTKLRNAPPKAVFKLVRTLRDGEW